MLIVTQLVQGRLGTWIPSHYLGSFFRPSLENKHSIVFGQASGYFTQGLQPAEDELWVGDGIQRRVDPNCSWCAVPPQSH